MAKYYTACKCGNPLEIDYEPPTEKNITCSKCGIIVNFKADSLGIIVTFG